MPINFNIVSTKFLNLFSNPGFISNPSDTTLNQIGRAHV